jgi:hypothetical protein
MIRTWLLALTTLVWIQTPSFAWDQHQQMMELILDSNPQVLPHRNQPPLIIPSEADQKKELAVLAAELQINPEKIPLQKPGKISVLDFIIGDAVDEPDFGMDQNLPDSADPAGDRSWMGGKQGPTSQGFRHMVFPGIEWGSPLRTLQVPTRSIGQAPERILKLQKVSQQYFAAKKDYWGWRILLWEIHLLQDLYQPFHVMQIPYYRMLPWSDLFSGFVARSTQVVSNYHFAYEGLIRESMSESILSELAPCVQIAGAATANKAIANPVTVNNSYASNPSVGNPSVNHGGGSEVNAASIQEVIRQSRKSAEEIGIPLYQLWDPIMKDPEVNLPEEMGSIDYYAFLHASTEEEEQSSRVQSVQQLMKTTCGILKNLSTMTISELNRALKN